MIKGSKQTQEAKDKIRAAKLGKLFTEEHSKAIGAALKGRKKTAEHRQAIAESVKAARLRKQQLLQESEKSNEPV